MHAVVQDICEGIGEKGERGEDRNDEQNANAPAMMPLATAAGKSLYARRVKGHSRVAKRTGGITRRRLGGGKGNKKSTVGVYL